MTPFWWSWPSWDVELVGGSLLAGAWLALFGGDVPASAIAAAASSLFYEFVLDPNRGLPGHHPWRDASQRIAGSLAALAVYLAARNM